MVFEPTKSDLLNATSTSKPRKPKNRISGSPIFSTPPKFLTNLIELRSLIVRKTSGNFLNLRKSDFGKSDFAFSHVESVPNRSVLHANTHGIFAIPLIYCTICQWKSEIHEFLEKKVKKTHPFLDGIFSN